jgi:hypothetical protein
MIANLLGGFVAILLGSSLIAPISVEVNTAACSSNASHSIYGAAGYRCDSSLYNATSWGSTVLKLVPGFFALSILGVGIAVTYTSLRQAGIV